MCRNCAAAGKSNPKRSLELIELFICHDDAFHSLIGISSPFLYR